MVVDSKMRSFDCAHHSFRKLFECVRAHTQTSKMYINAPLAGRVKFMNHPLKKMKRGASEVETI
jgi:hypothetical protein